MMLGFKRRFAPMVEEGSKTHTLRGKRKIRPRVGETLHCYVDPRQKTMRLLGRWKCTKVEDVLITDTGAMFIQGQQLDEDEKREFAWRDGFRTRGKVHAFEEFMDYWRSLKAAGKKRPLPFNGDLIHWRYEAA